MTLHETRHPKVRSNEELGRVNPSGLRAHLPLVKNATASRDLKFGVKNRTLKKRGQRRMTLYSFA